MVAFISLFLALFSLVFSSSVYANSFSAKLCEDTSTFSCYKVQKGDTWQTLFTDEEEREIVMKVNRINIKLRPGMKIAIPHNLDQVTLLDYAPFPRQIDATGNKVIMVSLNPEVIAWGAYDEQGILANWGPVSGGKSWCSDIGRGCSTKTGSYTVYRKQGAGCKSTKFPVGRGGAPMPYCMFFHGGFALHGSYEVPGYNASHGCVRLFIPDAQWINEEFIMDQKDVAVIITKEA